MFKSCEWGFNPEIFGDVCTSYEVEEWTKQFEYLKSLYEEIEKQHQENGDLKMFIRHFRLFKQCVNNFAA